MISSPKIPYGGKATAIFGLILIAVFWIGTTQRGMFETAEAEASELSKNANLALALDVQTKQVLAGVRLPDYRVLQAANGQEALDVYRANGLSIAAVLIDMTMPVLGGVPTMRELVKLSPEIRIIAASGIHDNEAAAKSIGRQVIQFLAKPFTSDTLLRAVARAVTTQASGAPAY